MKKKTVIIVSAIVVFLALIIAGIFWVPKILFPDENHPIIYTIDDIESMLFLSPEDTYEFEKVNTENLSNFNYILDEIDKKVGEGEYYIYSIYPTDIHFKDEPDGYGIHIILKDYVDEFNSLPNNSLNPYSIFFHYSTTDLSFRKVYDGYYSFLAARDYEIDFKEAMEKEFEDFQVNLYSNFLDSYRLNKYNGSWEEALDKAVFNGHSMNIVHVFVPYGTDAKAVAEDFEEEEILKDFYIEAITVFVLEEDVDMKSIDEKSNQYSDGIYDKFSYRVDKSGNLK